MHCTLDIARLDASQDGVLCPGIIVLIWHENTGIINQQSCCSHASFQADICSTHQVFRERKHDAPSTEPASDFGIWPGLKLLRDLIGSPARVQTPEATELDDDNMAFVTGRRGAILSDHPLRPVMLPPESARGYQRLISYLRTRRACRQSPNQQPTALLRVDTINTTFPVCDREYYCLDLGLQARLSRSPKNAHLAVQKSGRQYQISIVRERTT